MTFNLLDAGEMLEFSKSVRSIQLVVVVVICDAISLCNIVLKVVCSPITSNCYDWMCWSCVSLFFLLFSLCVVSSAIFRVWVLHVLGYRVGAVAPCFTCSGTVTTSFVGRKCILSVFVPFWGVLCFA